MYKFFTCGDTIHVYHYQVSGKLDGSQDVVVYAATKDEAVELSGRLTNSNIKDLDVTDVIWLDGIKVSASLDPMATAVKIYEMGETEYKTQQARIENSRNEQLRADLDYVMLMGGL